MNSPRSISRRLSSPTQEIAVTLCPAAVGASGKHYAILFLQ
jgi:hypothetical protein